MAGPFGIFQHPFCRQTSKKLKGALRGKKIRKKSHNAKKTERGDHFGFSKSIVAKHQKIEGGHLGNFSKKVSHWGKN